MDSTENVIDEEDFTRARIHLSNMRIEIRTLTEQRNILEEAEREAKSQAEASLRDLSSCRRRMSELESQTSTLQISLKEMEADRQSMEDGLQCLNNQLISLRCKEQEAMMAAEHDRQKDEAKRVLEMELQQERERSLRQITALKAEIVNKECLISQLME